MARSARRLRSTLSLPVDVLRSGAAPIAGDVPHAIAGSLVPVALTSAILVFLDPALARPRAVTDVAYWVASLAVLAAVRV